MEDPSSVMLIPRVEELKPNMNSSTSPSTSSCQDKEKKKKKKEKKKKKDKKNKKEKKKRRDDDNDGDEAGNEPSCCDDKKKAKRRKKESLKDCPPPKSSSSLTSSAAAAAAAAAEGQEARPAVESSAVDPNATATLVDVEAAAAAAAAAKEKQEDSKKKKNDENDVTLLLFYQYVEPPWSDKVYKEALQHVEMLGKQAGITGRMRVAKEGLNCTLTGSKNGILTYCRSLRTWKPDCFLPTEFKLTHDLPRAQRFRELKIIHVTELVHYGLDGAKAPMIRQYQGTHLEPRDYHEKLASGNAVVIDVRNHYEAAIGRFNPPVNGAAFLDPNMRKSTEFPVWLDDDTTKERLRNKQVLMYCTGGIRCERASALLKYKMTNDPSVKDLNIQGVYQLQGGIDKYFKEFPQGGYWKGKNYVFDKRFAHAPPSAGIVEGNTSTMAENEKDNHGDETMMKDDQKLPAVSQPPTEDHAMKSNNIMGQCEACQKPWDKYRVKRRCPTCGVPSLICRDCWQGHQDGIRKLDKRVRCDLCVEQGIHSKHELRQREAEQLQAYERRMKEKGLLHAAGSSETEKQQQDGKKTTTVSTTYTTTTTAASTAFANPNGVTRLYVKNMCRNNMTEQLLVEHIPGITHVVWRIDRRNDFFYGQAWVEMVSAEAAARAVSRSGQKVLGRPLYISYQPPDGKDIWPPPSSAVIASPSTTSTTTTATSTDESHQKTTKKVW